MLAGTAGALLLARRLVDQAARRPSDHPLPRHLDVPRRRQPFVRRQHLGVRRRSRPPTARGSPASRSRSPTAPASARRTRRRPRRHRRKALRPAGPAPPVGPQRTRRGRRAPARPRAGTGSASATRDRRGDRRRRRTRRPGRAAPSWPSTTTARRRRAPVDAGTGAPRAASCAASQVGSGGRGGGHCDELVMVQRVVVTVLRNVLVTREQSHSSRRRNLGTRSCETGLLDAPCKSDGRRRQRRKAWKGIRPGCSPVPPWCC